MFSAINDVTSFHVLCTIPQKLLDAICTMSVSHFSVPLHVLSSKVLHFYTLFNKYAIQRQYRVLLHRNRKLE